jgi:hypothetical protein
MEAAKLSQAVARIHAGVMALVFAILCGGGLFVMTAWLLIKGGENVGIHLQLLGHYFIGYSVSWKGSFVGLVYGVAVGWIVGWTIGMIYNRIVGLRQR